MKIWLKIRRPFIMGVMILVLYLMQTTVFAALELGGIKPDLLVIITSAIGVIRGRKEGMLVGFFSGLLLDVQTGSLLGFYALIFVMIGYLNGYARHVFFNEELKLPLILIGCSEFGYGMVIYILRFFLRSEFQFVYYLSHIIIPQLIYTIIVAFVFYPLIVLINQKLEAEEKRSASKFV